MNLKCHVDPRAGRQRPSIELEPTDHPLAKQKGITDLVEAQKLVGQAAKAEYKIHDSAYMTSCYTCHR